MYKIYNIKEYDNLSSIADNYNTTELELRQINGLDNNIDIKELNQLVVPFTNNIYDYYTVKKGDNIYSIATSNNIDPNLLLSINGLNKDDYIYPNQTIIIPKNKDKIYLTKEQDTINNLIDKLNIEIEDLLKENKSIYLLPDQILFFKEK